MAEQPAKAKVSLSTRVVALLIIVVAVWVVLKLLIGFISGVSVFWGFGLIGLGIGVLWALRALR
ncbi:MAG: hypothetical protein WCJ63_01920 [Actinomycetes bacterium]